jgi:hypothetical protein
MNMNYSSDSTSSPNAHHCLGMAHHPEQHKEALLKKLTRIIEWAGQKPLAVRATAKHNTQLNNDAFGRAMVLDQA